MDFLRSVFAKIAGVLISRKFWAAVGATIAVFTVEIVDPGSAVLAVVGIWVAYILGTAVEEGLARAGGAPKV